MRIVIHFVIFLIILPAQAATISFDDMTAGDMSPSFVTPQGYEFANLGFGYLGPTVEPSSPSNNSLYFNGPDWFPAITMTNFSNQPFSLQQLDVFFFTPGNDGLYDQYAQDVVIRAEDASGALIAEKTVLYSEGFGWRTVSFDSAWSGISSLKLGWSVVDAYSATAAYDNIVVTAVPIPAAVWLFGSALAGLGWMRRKQTV